MDGFSFMPESGARRTDRVCGYHYLCIKGDGKGRGKRNRDKGSSSSSSSGGEEEEEGVGGLMSVESTEAGNNLFNAVVDHRVLCPSS
jgi:hypothetical protein